jgi:hypothetical protein
MSPSHLILHYLLRFHTPVSIVLFIVKIHQKENFINSSRPIIVNILSWFCYWDCMVNYGQVFKDISTIVKSCLCLSLNMFKFLNKLLFLCYCVMLFFINDHCLVGYVHGHLDLYWLNRLITYGIRGIRVRSTGCYPIRL